MVQNIKLKFRLIKVIFQKIELNYFLTLVAVLKKYCQKSRIDCQKYYVEMYIAIIVWSWIIDFQ